MSSELFGSRMTFCRISRLAYSLLTDAKSELKHCLNIQLLCQVLPYAKIRYLVDCQQKGEGNRCENILDTCHRQSLVEILIVAEE